MSEELHQKILSVLERIRPCLKIDGGDIELADLSEDGFVRLRFLGGVLDLSTITDDVEGWRRADSDVGTPGGQTSRTSQLSVAHSLLVKSTQAILVAVVLNCLPIFRR